MDQSHYLSTERLGNGETIKWVSYGRQGLIEAIESADWNVKRGNALSVKVERLMPNGYRKAVYRRAGDSTWTPSP